MKLNDTYRNADFFRILTDNSFDIISVLGEDGTILFENDATKKILGYGNGERYGKNAFEYVHPDDREEVERQFRLLLRTGGLTSVEFRFAKNDGRYVWLEAKGQNYLRHPAIAGVIVNSRDITDRKAVEEQIEQNQKRYDRVQAIGKIGNWEYYIESKYFCGSDQAKKIYGFAPDSDSFTLEEVESRIVERERIHNALINLIEKGVPYDEEFDIITADKEIRKTIVSKAEMEYDAAGKPLRVNGVIRDITAEKEAKKISDQYMRQYQLLFQDANDAMLFADADTGIIVDANKKAEELLNCDRDYLIGIHQSKLHPESVRDEATREFRADAEGKWDGHFHHSEIVTKDGKEVPVEISTASIILDGKKYMYGIFRDITVRKEADRKIKESEEKFKKMFESDPEPILLAHRDSGEIIDANQAAAILFRRSREELIGMNQAELHPADEMAKAQEYFKKHPGHQDLSTPPVEIDITLPDGKIKPVHIRGLTIDINDVPHVLGIFRDISELKKNEQAVNHLLKLYREKEFSGPDQILDKGLEIAMDICNSEISYLHFVDNEKNTLHLRAWSAGAMEMCSIENVITEYPLANAGVWADCVREKKHIIHNDYPAMTDTNGLPEGHIPINRHISVPVTEDGKTVAIMGLGNKEEEYSEYDARYLQLIAENVKTIYNQKLTETELEESRNRFKRLVDELPDIVYVYSQKTGTVYLSDSAESVFGYCKSELLENPKLWNESIHPEDKKVVKYTLNNLKVGGGFDIEYRIFDKNNDVHYLRDRGFSIRKIDGDLQIEGVASDITNQKNSEYALKESEEKFKSVALNATEGLVVLNNKHEIEFVSPAYQKLLGYSKEEEIGKNAKHISDVIHPDDRNGVFEDIYRAIQEKKDSLTYTYRAKHKDGHYIWRKDRAGFVYDDELNYQKSYVVCSDITEQKNNEEALLKSEKQLKILNSSLVDMLAVTDISDAYKYMVDTISNYFPNSAVIYISVDEKDMTTKPEYYNGIETGFLENLIAVTGFNPLEKQYGMREELLEIFKTGQLHKYQKGLVDYSAGQLPAAIAATVEKMFGISSIYSIGIKNDNEVFGALHIFKRDKEEIKDGRFVDTLIRQLSFVIRNELTKHELKISEAKYREANATKDKFFNIIAHDLQNPFNSILGFSKLGMKAIDKETQPELHKYCSVIYKTTRAGYGLLGNLLQWARMQTSRLEFKPEKIKTTELISSVLHLFDAGIKEKSIEFVSNFDNDIEVFADRNMLETVLRNLIANALKYTNLGGTVTVTTNQNKSRTSITVEDTGIGIAQERLDNLFSSELKISEKGTNNESGTGLGLMLCKEFVDRHGGEIEVESQLGKGSTFRVLLNN